MAERKSEASGAATDPAAAAESKKKRSRLLQEDVPSITLEQALRVPKAIADGYAYKPTRPLNVAQAMGMTPTSGPFRTITGAAVAYGITTGAAQAPEIGITPLGMRITRPTTEGDDIAAKREALLRPKIVGEFLRTYDNAALPTDAIAKNVLQEKGVPADRLDDVLQMITDGAKAVGFIREWSGKRYVDLAGPIATADSEDAAVVSQEAPVAPAVGHAPRGLLSRAAAPVAVSVGPGIHINIEIHIAADASSETVEDIFRNMRRYILTGDGQADDGQADDGTADAG
ncbi:MAG: hypothetical protein ACRDVN_11760 [Jiangellaceae bacterium]